MTRPSCLVPHPFLLALYPILLVYTRNDDSIYFGETLAALIVTSLGTLALFAVLGRAWNNPGRAGLVVSAGLFVLFSFERNVHVVQVRGWVPAAGAREWLVLGAELVLFAVWLILVRLDRFPVRVITTMANAASVALLCFLVPALVAATLSAPRPAPASPGLGSAVGPLRPSTTRPPGRDPDIYFLVLDAFGRSDILKAMFDLDIDGFLARMEQRGFTVARESTANYCQTALSISATLSGEYHHNLADSRSRSRLPLRDLMRTNSWLTMLKSRGYKTVGFATGFGLSDGFVADERLGPSFHLAEFNALLLDMTPLPTLLGQGAGQGSHQRHRQRILSLFDQLPAVADDPRPTFCLAHVLSPHPPFVFDQTGGDVSGENTVYRLTDGILWSALDGHGGPEDYAAHYRNQAAYLLERVEAAVDQILQRSPERPVIIIQGDHGPGSHFDPGGARPNDLPERMSILNLAMIPGGGQTALYPTITPVNTFRLVADAVFDTNRGLLPDRNYYSSYQLPYTLIDVTADLGRSPRQAAGRGE